MHYIEDLKRTLCEELEEIAQKGDLSAGDLDTVDKLAHTIKNLDKIMMGEGDYSNAGDWAARGSYDRGRVYYDGGNSYRNRHRDSMGRYSRADAKEDIVRKLRRMLDDTSDGKIREALEAALREMEG